jgi:sugar/nucleoside kinase (ribokinase family)
VVTGRVVVVGDLVTDVVTRLHHRLVPGSDTPARIRVTGGGQAANTAAWLDLARGQPGYPGRWWCSGRSSPRPG